MGVKSLTLRRTSVVSSPSGDLSPADLKPVERQVEARPVDDALGSMVRCLYFARSYIISSKRYVR